ncbi:MAG: aromatic ring-hydroxylating dioxygenase subunit alpha [Acidimicrobiaceae bacterium]|nr:aromatic ring-hydroxylating dioxygenase subunit alpha [Acidimicrobiaceae bacterium]
MATVERQWSALPVPYAIEYPDRVPKQRYYDPDFYAMEAELFWPRVWQMACRLEEIPEDGDFVEYEILDQSIVVVRTSNSEVKAFYNACRHRGVKLVEGRGNCRSGFTCSFHGWCYGLDGANTFLYQPDLFAEHNRRPEDLNLTPVRCEIWGGCAWINLDDGAPPLRDQLEPFASVHDAWKVESLRTEWWYSCRLPTNWKLAMEAFMEGYHVLETHPQLNPPGVKKSAKSVYKELGTVDALEAAISRRTAGISDPRQLIDSTIYYMRTLSDGMAGMTHANDVRIAEGLRNMEVPDDPALAIATWGKALNDAVVQWYRGAGCDIPDLNELAAKGITSPIGFCFPHYFLLPTFSSASSYRIRPLGPEETLFELWSLTRFPPGREPGKPTPPEPWEADDPRWPPIPGQDYSNLPKQQKGLHAKGFEYMRLSDEVEGLISNFERVVDGYLAGLPDEKLVPAIQKVNGTIDVPIADLGF